MDNEMLKIAVVGSFMMDLVIKAERRPQRGETLVGQSFGVFPGGKGYNQAVAARRLGAGVSMIGKLGEDDFGQRFIRAMKEDAIDSSHVLFDKEAHTGIGSPVIDAQGDNSIIIVPGANMQLTPQDVDLAREAIAAADLLMLQLEIPLETVIHAAEIAHQAKVPVLLNPAPARPLPPELLKLVTLLVPNETEAEMLSGQKIVDDTSAVKAAKILQDRGVETVVITLGGQGALIADSGRFIRVQGYLVDVVDTTAAGDAFCAGLAVQYARKQPLEKAVLYANSVGALACTVMGATPAMPRQEVVERFGTDKVKPPVYPLELP